MRRWSCAQVVDGRDKRGHDGRGGKAREGLKV